MTLKSSKDATGGWGNLWRLRSGYGVREQAQQQCKRQSKPVHRVSPYPPRCSYRKSSKRALRQEQLFNDGPGTSKASQAFRTESRGACFCEEIDVPVVRFCQYTL